MDERVEVMRAALEKALVHSSGEYGVDDILDLVEQRRAHLWEFEDDTFAVTVRVEYPRIVRLRIILFAGRMNDMFYDRFVEIAKAMGASGLECFGRPGWERRLERFGARPAYTVMVKDWGAES